MTARRRWRTVGSLLVCLLGGGCGFTENPLAPLPAEIRVPDIWYGVSTAPYQVEDPGVAPGDPGFFQTDWDAWPEHGGQPIPKAEGAWSFTENGRDLEKLQWLGVTHYRFGIEWARVEPQPGEYNQQAIQYYVDYARHLHEAGIEPIICFWHFTFPAWLAHWNDPAQYGWLHPLAAERWAAYVAMMTEQLAPYVSLYAPQNEPDIQTQAAFMVAQFPPGLLFRQDLADCNVEASVTAFLQAAEIIRREYAEHAGPDRPAVRITSVQALVWWEADPLDTAGTFRQAIQDAAIPHTDRVQEALDILGFTYYGKEYVSLPWILARPWRTGPGFTEAGLAIYPEGLTQLIAWTWERYQKPMLILENGICDSSDAKRPDYLVRHIDAVQNAISQGYPVLGYFHWSLMDNYEWRDAYNRRFGLFSVNPTTRALEAKDSAYVYRAIIAVRGGTYTVALP